MLTLNDRPIGQATALILAGNVSSLVAYKDGVAASGLTYTLTSLSVTGPTRFTFTPTTTGLYSFVDGSGEVVAHIEAVAKSTQAYLKNIEDEALGSWTWNRVDGTLQLLRQDGSELANFAVVDTQTESSRERLL